ncbi:tonB-system energizer ExbB [Asaia sp. As-1742]|uniref:tonB-system energizer ExbB n=1 Tax=Asaia sp. As-1742 TaxID=2608325 RepID=UPI001420F034|nr:tonB-system energizer ExbB [Asaia sp. As-1742]NIE79601.1 tonB-system energizer ExbB [Asaia sp. As-1742]
MAAPAGDLASLPFTPWEMFLGAGPVVRFVMMLLIVACVISWAVFVAKVVEVMRVRRALSQAELKLENAASLAESQSLCPDISIVRALLLAASNEWTRSADVLEDREGLKERIMLHLERLEAAEGRRLMRGTGILATIGATSPFIGLFGTVWGIMTSFTGIAATKATSLAVVAPGIAEALLATALGLVAAIPAVVIYNFLSRQCLACKAQVGDLTALILRLVSRDLSRLHVQGGGGQVLRFATPRAEQAGR